MKRGCVLVLAVICLGGLIWTTEQVERDLKKPLPLGPLISSVSQRNQPDDIEIVVTGTNFPTGLGYQLKFGDHILARPSAWTSTRASGIVPHNILGARYYPVSIINSLSKEVVSNTVQYFLLYNLTGYTPKLWVGPGTRIKMSTPLGFDRVEVSIYIKFDDHSIWAGFTFLSPNWTVDFDIPKDVKVPSVHNVYLTKAGKTISNTITINVTGLPPIRR